MGGKRKGTVTANDHATGSCCTRCCKLCAVPVLLLGLAAGGLQYALQQPKYAEAAVRKVVEFGGLPQTVFDCVKVVDDSAWYEIITKGNLGIAEGYMHGTIELPKGPLALFRTLMNGTAVGTRRKEGTDFLGIFFDLVSMPAALAGRLTNQQSRDRSTRVTKQHYDAGNDLYEAMLGPSMSYTCAYWRNAKNLDEAQTNKFNLIFRKLELEPGMKVADLGMGWGTAAAYMHANGKNVEVTGVSLSEEQVKWAKENLKKPGLEFVLSDYRDHCEDPAKQHTYDRVYSIGMLEHVGWKNQISFFKCVKKLLKPDGLAVIHTIGEPDFVPASDLFLDKYIFPGAVIPAMSTVIPAIENDFILEDWQNFGHDYSKTLAAWSVNADKFFKETKNSKYTPEFQRMWDYYLKMCEALFELRINQLWHFVLSPRPATRQRITRQI
jgi:cyclopropane-fatty-acyl-phospholipid synthase